jgi:hypothetical protein
LREKEVKVRQKKSKKSWRNIKRKNETEERNDQRIKGERRFRKERVSVRLEENGKNKRISRR